MNSHLVLSEISHSLLGHANRCAMPPAKQTMTVCDAAVTRFSAYRTESSPRRCSPQRGYAATRADAMEGFKAAWVK